MKYRAVVSARSFDLERQRIEDGAWEKLSYCRRRSDLEATLKKRGLPLNLADGLPEFHPDVLKAVGRFTGARQAPIRGRKVSECQNGLERVLGLRGADSGVGRYRVPRITLPSVTDSGLKRAKLTM